MQVSKDFKYDTSNENFTEETGVVQRFVAAEVKAVLIILFPGCSLIVRLSSLRFGATRYQTEPQRHCTLLCRKVTFTYERVFLPVLLFYTTLLLTSPPQSL